MHTPVEVSLIRRSATKPSGVEGLGGIQHYRHWYAPEYRVIEEIERPHGKRVWDYFVVIEGVSVPLAVAWVGGCKHIIAAGISLALLGLPEWQDHDERGWPIRPVE
jgi:hypothetical protein